MDRALVDRGFGGQSLGKRDGSCFRVASSCLFAPRGGHRGQRKYLVSCFGALVIVSGALVFVVGALVIVSGALVLAPHGGLGILPTI